MLFYLTSLHVSYVLKDSEPTNPCHKAHMQFKKDVYILPEVNEPEPLFMGNKTALKIEGKENVILKLNSGNDLVLSNVFHVPQRI
uniref:Thioredoxin reductase 2-like n=1 Tax=Tanacetum cinerariifolium TaxID=118510 RepID=A0A6L2NSU6_TANCI|nr:thioredoxin reductase 2-like [Tanacetum cinerariifolium]